MTNKQTSLFIGFILTVALDTTAATNTLPILGSLNRRTNSFSVVSKEAQDARRVSVLQRFDKNANGKLDETEKADVYSEIKKQRTEAEKKRLEIPR